MTYRISSGSDRWLKLAVPVFIVLSIFLLLAFKGSIATAQNEETNQQLEYTSMELTYYGYNP
ncbi:MAG: hypothetical protein WBM02_04050 [bacterium]